MESDWSSSQTFHSSERRHRGFTPLLSNEVDDADGRDREQVGEEVTERKATKRTIQQGHNNEMEMSAEIVRDTDSFYLEPMRCAHIGKVWINV